MNRTTVNFVLDSVLLLLFVALTCVTTMLRFVFPAGPDARGWRLWGLEYADWSDAQFALIAILFGCVVLHVMLHWSWVCGVVGSRFGQSKKGKLDDGIRTLYGVGLLIAVLHVIAIFLTAASLTIEDPTAVDVSAAEKHSPAGASR